MKQKHFLLFIGAFLLACTCGAQDITKSIKDAIGELLYTEFTGTATVKASASNRFLLLVNTEKSTTHYDKAIVLFSEEKIISPFVEEGRTYAFYIPSNRRYIVIQSLADNQISVIGLSDDDATKSINQFKSSDAIKPSLSNTDAFGYGLSFMSGLWSIEKVTESKYKFPFNTLGYADAVNTEAAKGIPPSYDLEPADDALCDKGECTSGGAGSTSCSITENVIGISQTCNVSCSAGYYACCRSKDVRCYCCKI